MLEIRRCGVIDNRPSRLKVHPSVLAKKKMVHPPKRLIGIMNVLS